ncbi:MAG: aminodeoxychorismate synthase component I [bacterium]
MAAFSDRTERRNETVHHTLVALDLTLPFWRYLPMNRQSAPACLLDSGMDPRKLGRFSFLGGDPFLIFRMKRQRDGTAPAPANVEIIQRRADNGSPLVSPHIHRVVDDPFTALRLLLDRYRVPASFYDLTAIGYDGPTPPLLAGAMGYIGFETACCTERLPDHGSDDIGLPDMYFLFLDTVLVHCHETGRSWLSCLGRGPDPASARRMASRLVTTWRERIAGFESNPPPEWTGPATATDDPDGDPRLPVTAHFGRQSYCRAVQRAKDHILAGDVFELCLSHRLESPLPGDPWDLYQELRRVNPAPFAAFLELPEAQVVCASPERFLRLEPDRTAESRPLKGTRPRGATPAADEHLRQELISSEKDRAENLMIVDLLRNDFGRVCEIGSVTVPELLLVEEYATVFQLVSTIRGKLAAAHDSLDLIRACFPGGSMTGAPKIEALKIIDAMEPVKRGIYAGAIGYLDFAGTLDLNIVIRSIVCRDERCYYNVGGAIVADSDPEAEYQETLDKARALQTALRNLARVAADKGRSA